MKRVRIANRSRFTFSVSFLLVLTITLSILAFASITSNGDTEQQFLKVNVQAGDTIWSIARTHSTESVDIREIVYNIRTENKLVSSIIHPGQELLIPIDFREK